MKHLKPFNESILSREEITTICDKFNIKNWTINSEGLVEAEYIDLYNSDLDKLPLKFGNIGVDFYCNVNYLTSLEGSPKYVGGDFDCSNNNELLTLVGAPKIVGAHFYCFNNKLTSFVGAPEIIGGELYCRDNNIISFEGFPKSVGNFQCVGNPIYAVWKLFRDTDKIELFNEFDIIRGKQYYASAGDIIMDRLNDFLITIGVDPVENVEGYNNI